MAGPQPEGIAAGLSGVVAGAQALASSLLDLLGLEARRASLALILMLACGAAGAALFVASWLAVMAAAALWSAPRIGWEATLCALAAATLCAAFALGWLCVRASRSLAFPATRRQLRPKLDLV
jgi:uncharacterized membrane protein YqjE